MTAKEYLMQYRQAARRVTAAQDHLTELRAIAERMTPSYSTSGSGQPGDRLGATVARIVEAEDRLEAEIELLIATEREIVQTINRVSEPYRTLLYERYINGKTWEQIAVIMNYSWRQTVRLHGIALNAVKDVIECHI